MHNNNQQLVMINDYLRRRRGFSQSVCLSVRRITEKKLWTDFDEISCRGRAWPRDQVIKFWHDDPGHRPAPEVRSPKSEFTGLSKKYLVDSDQSRIANLHCKNHSAILLCWRSAEVWVLPVNNAVFAALLFRIYSTGQIKISLVKHILEEIELIGEL